MLAWLRTGVAIVAFGFVVARFGLLLRLIHPEAGLVAGHGLSAYLGGALVGLGVLAIAGGTVQYQRFCRSLSVPERPTSASPRFVLGLSWALVVIGAALGIVLLA
jgi:putative membrane protein